MTDEVVIKNAHPLAKQPDGSPPIVMCRSSRSGVADGGHGERPTDGRARTRCKAQQVDRLQDRARAYAICAMTKSRSAPSCAVRLGQLFDHLSGWRTGPAQHHGHRLEQAADLIRSVTFTFSWQLAEYQQVDAQTMYYDQLRDDIELDGRDSPYISYSVSLNEPCYTMAAHALAKCCRKSAATETGLQNPEHGAHG